MARRRRRHARKARSNPRKRRARRVSRRNPLRGRKSRRRVRRNPVGTAKQTVKSLGGADWLGSPGLGKGGGQKKPRKKHRKLSAKARRRRAVGYRLGRKALSLRKRARGMKSGARKSNALTQARRLSSLARVARRGGKLSRSPVYKAMHIKSNPGIAGLIVAAKALAPQAAVGAGSMVLLALGGKAISARISASAPAAIIPYVPAISTVLLTGAAYVAADKFAPKFKGAVAIGGLLGAIVQAVVAAAAASPGGMLAKAKDALLGPAALVVAPEAPPAAAAAAALKGIGDYTNVGALEARDGGAYSNQRPRRALQDNATQWALSGALEARDGGAYSNQRPRRALQDNSTEWAVDGVDDTTEFAPGEGGVLSGGLFR